MGTLADLPALGLSGQKRPAQVELEVAARADNVTRVIWKHVNSKRGKGQRVTECLRRIRFQLENLQNQTSSDYTGPRLWDAMRQFPYLVAQNEFHDALEKIRPDMIEKLTTSIALLPHRPPTVSEEIAIIDTMLLSLAKEGARPHVMRKDVIDTLTIDHQWLTGRSRNEYGSQFREFVGTILKAPSTRSFLPTYARD